MNDIKARSLRYSQLPGTPYPGFALGGLHDRTFQFWMDFWTQLFRSNGSSALPNPDDFLRQEAIGVLEHDGEIVGLHGHGYFDLSLAAPRKSSYFARYFGEAFYETLRRRGAERVLSMETYALRPEWRQQALGVSLASVMIGLSLRVAEAWRVDASVGIARIDIGVHRFVQAQGGVFAGPEVQVYNTPCRPVAIFAADVRPHPKAAVNSLVERFWRNRVDALPPMAPKTTPLKKTA